MTRFDRPEQDRTASLNGSEARDTEYCCGIFDMTTNIQWHVFKERYGKRRYIVDGADDCYEPLDDDIFSVFNYIVNKDNSSHDFYFDFVNYDVNEKEASENRGDIWLACFHVWQHWVDGGCKDE